MTAHCAKPTTHSYFVVAIDYGRRGVEAIVDPELTRRDVVARLVSGEYQNVAFIHHIEDMLAEDVTDALLNEAEAACRLQAAE